MRDRRFPKVQTYSDLTKEVRDKEKEINRLQTDIERLKNEYSANDLEAIREENTQKTAQISILSNENKKLNKIVNVFIKTLQKLSECGIDDFPKFKRIATSHIPTTAEGLSEEDLCEMEKEWDEEKHVYARRMTRGR